MTLIDEPPGPSSRLPGHMAPSDAVMWDIEREPQLRSTVVAVALLDQAPDWDRLEHRLRSVTRQVPRLRQRVVTVPVPGALPLWVDDQAFDLSYHLRRVSVPEPGGLRQVLDLAQPLAMAAFDPARPLWEFTVVEGMAGGRAALIQKFHHTITDGVGAVQLAMTMLDARREGDPPSTAEVESSGETSALADVARAVWRAPGGAVRSSWDVARDPFGASGRALGLARSIVKTVAPVPASESTLLGGRSLARTFDTIEVPLADLRAAAHVAGGTVNDAFMASVVEGLRRYHQRHDCEIDVLRLNMPVSLRSSQDPMGGNHWAPARFSVPAAIDDPVTRMQRLGELSRGWRQEPALAHTDAIAWCLHCLPHVLTTSVMGAMLRHVDTVVTDVPGLVDPAYLAGAEVLEQYAFAPTGGAALNVSLVSHLDRACIGVVVDRAAIPDEDVVVACLVEGIDDVVSVAAHHPVRTA